MNRKTFIILFLIVALGGLLRFPLLSRFPAGFSADEAVQGYTAFSILKTGEDEWGQFLPLNPRSFGDYKPPLYTYLTVPSVALFGLNEFAVRLPSALLGVLGVLGVFLLVQELFGITAISLLSAFFIAICPWHLVFSRAAIEANLTAFFFPMGFYFFLKGLKKSKYLPLSALFWGLNIYTYHSARLFTLLFALLMIIWNWKKIKFRDKKVWLTIILALIFVLPILISIFKGGVTKRFGDVSLFNPTDKGQEIEQRQRESLLIEPLPILFNNKLTWISEKFTQNYFSYFSLDFLFTNGSLDNSYSNLSGRGLLHPWELPLLLATVWFFYKRREKRRWLLLAWLFLAGVPAAITKEPAHANRASTFLPLWSILSAYGAYFLWEFFTKKLSAMVKKIIFSLILVLIFISLAFFLEEYFSHAPKKLAKGLSYGYRETINYLSTVENDYDKIVMTKRFSEPQIFVAFYKKYDPALYQKEAQDFLRYERNGLIFLDQLGVYRLGKYEFRDINWGADKNLKKTLIVGGLEDFTIGKVVPLKTIYYPNGREAFLIIEAENYRGEK
ncbi:glycosyltransferase family 39 protein [Patescibacteria group bacterium]|nr:glycosyltransferase family 39 protein [Patescibacteria group bacterium]